MVRERDVVEGTFRNKHEPRKRRERRRIECVCVKPKVCTKVEKVDAKYGSENLPFISFLK